MADVASSVAHKVPLLTRDNWLIWSERMALLLRLNRCWSAVKPPAAAATSSASTTTTTAAPEVPPEDDLKALAHIGLHLSDELIHHAPDAGSARELWNLLESQFVTHISAQKLTLKRELTSLKQRELESFEEFFGRALQLRRKLAMVRVEVSDDDLATTILFALTKTAGNRHAGQAR